MSAVTTVFGSLPKHCPVFEPFAALFCEEGLRDHLEEHDLDMLGIPHPSYIHFDQDLFDVEVVWLR